MYTGVLNIFGRYWQAYGGGSALVRSPYLHAAAVLLVLTYATWSQNGWWEQVLSVMPNLLGFTLGGFAMFLGFGDEKFRSLLAEPDEDAIGEPTLYVSICATFVHFIVVQLFALVAAVVAKSWWFYFPWPEPIRVFLPFLNLFGWAFGYAFFLYALTSVLAATMHVFRIATMYEQHQQVQATNRASNDEK